MHLDRGTTRQTQSYKSGCVPGRPSTPRHQLACNNRPVSSKRYSRTGTGGPTARSLLVRPPGGVSKKLQRCRTATTSLTPGVADRTHDGSRLEGAGAGSRRGTSRDGSSAGFDVGTHRDPEIRFGHGRKQLLLQISEPRRPNSFGQPGIPSVKERKTKQGMRQLMDQESQDPGDHALNKPWIRKRHQSQGPKL